VEVAGLRSAQKDADELKVKVESLDKALSDSKAAEQLALARAQKANETTEGLRKEIDAEKESNATLVAQVALLNKHLDEAKAVGLSATDLYMSALSGFGAITPPLPADVSTYGTFSWVKANFSKLPEFVGKAGDFAALSSATNLSKTMAKLCCEHVKGLRRKKDFESPAELGEAPKNFSKAVKSFISSFWI
jgi:hypothetical protein